MAELKELDARGSGQSGGRRRSSSRSVGTLEERVLELERGGASRTTEGPSR
jgi:hypothetical protein